MGTQHNYLFRVVHRNSIWAYFQGSCIRHFLIKYQTQVLSSLNLLAFLDFGIHVRCFDNENFINLPKENITGLQQMCHQKIPNLVSIPYNVSKNYLNLVE